MKKSIILFFVFCATILCGQTKSDSTDTFETLANGTVVYSKVDNVAEFPGGVGEFARFIQNNFLGENIHRKKVDGKVFLKFIVLADGTITNISVVKGIEKCPGCDTEAVRLITLSPKWNPARVKDVPVTSYYSFPFKITLK